MVYRALLLLGLLVAAVVPAASFLNDLYLTPTDNSEVSIPLHKPSTFVEKNVVTVTLWVRPKPLTEGLVFYYGGPDNNGFGLYVTSSGDVKVYFDAAYSSSLSVTLGDWASVVMIVDYTDESNPDVKLTVNGNTDQQTLSLTGHSAKPTSNFFYVGGKPGSGLTEHFWNGDVAMIMATADLLADYEIDAALMGVTPDNPQVMLVADYESDNQGNEMIYNDVNGTAVNLPPGDLSTWTCGDGQLQPWEQCDDPNSLHCLSCRCVPPAVPSGGEICYYPRTIKGADTLLQLGVADTVSTRAPFYDLSKGLAVTAWVNIATIQAESTIWEFTNANRTRGFAFGVEGVGNLLQFAIHDSSGNDRFRVLTSPECPQDVSIEEHVWTYLSLVLSPVDDNEYEASVYINGTLKCDIALGLPFNPTQAGDLFIIGGSIGIQMGPVMLFQDPYISAAQFTDGLTQRGVVPALHITTNKLFWAFDTEDNQLENIATSERGPTVPANQLAEWKCGDTVVDPWEQCDGTPGCTARCVCDTGYAPRAAGECVAIPIIVANSIPRIGQFPSSITIVGQNFGNDPNILTITFAPKGGVHIPTFVNDTMAIVEFDSYPSFQGFEVGKPLSVIMVRNSVADSEQTVICLNVIETPTLTTSVTPIADSATTLHIFGEGFGTDPDDLSVLLIGDNIESNCTITNVNNTFIECTPERSLELFPHLPEPYEYNPLKAVVTRAGAPSTNRDGNPVPIASIVATPIMSENLNSLAANAPILTVTGFDFWPEENDIIVTLFEVDSSTRACAPITITDTMLICAIDTSGGNLQLGPLKMTITIGLGSTSQVTVATVVDPPVVYETFTPIPINTSIYLIIYGKGFDPRPQMNNVELFTSTGNSRNFTATHYYQAEDREYITVWFELQSEANISARVTSFGGTSNTALIGYGSIVPFINRVPSDSLLAMNAQQLTIYGGNLGTSPTLTLYRYTGSEKNPDSWDDVLDDEPGNFVEVTYENMEANNTVVTCDINLTGATIGELLLAKISNGGQDTPLVVIYEIYGAPYVEADDQLQAATATKVSFTGSYFDTTRRTLLVEASVDGVIKECVPSSVSLTKIECEVPSELVNGKFNFDLEVRVTSYDGVSEWTKVASLIQAAHIDSDESYRKFAANARTLTIKGFGFAAAPSHLNNTVYIRFPDSMGVEPYECRPLQNTTSTTIICNIDSDMPVGRLEATVALFGGYNTKRAVPNYKSIGEVVPAPTLNAGSLELSPTDTSFYVTGTGFDTNSTYNVVTFRIGTNPITQGVVISGNDTYLLVSVPNGLGFTGDLYATVIAYGGSTNEARIGSVFTTPVTFDNPIFSPADIPPAEDNTPIPPPAALSPDASNVTPESSVNGGAIAAAVIIVIVVLAVAGFLAYWFMIRKRNTGKTVAMTGTDAEMKSDPWKAEERATQLEEEEYTEDSSDDDDDDDDDGDEDEE